MEYTDAVVLHIEWKLLEGKRRVSKMNKRHGIIERHCEGPGLRMIFFLGPK
jgi:hypothetical protein